MQIAARRTEHRNVEGPEPHVIELNASNGRPLRIVGTEVGEVVTREGAVIRVYRLLSGRRVLHRLIDNCWGGHEDMVIVESLDDDRLTELLGFGKDALAVYERLGVDPVWVIE